MQDENELEKICLVAGNRDPLLQVDLKLHFKK